VGSPLPALIGAVEAVQSARLTARLNKCVTPSLREQAFSRRGQRYVPKRGANSVSVQFERDGDFFACDVKVVSARL
jgi:hypothetical protein